MWSAPRSLGPPSVGVSVRKVLTVCVLTALMAVSGITVSGAIAADPPAAAPAASPAPSHTIDSLGDFTHVPGTGATQGLDWQPAVAPALEEGASLSRLTAWAGGFAALESWRDEEHQTRHAVLTSPDGRSWGRAVLPVVVREVAWLQPFRDGLVLLSLPRGSHRYGWFTLGVWRSPDGTSWPRVGTVAASLPRRLKQDSYWHIAPMELMTTKDGLVLLAAARYSVGSGGSVRDATVFVSGRARVRSDLHPDRIWGWTSEDGSRWTRRPAEGVLAANGHGSVELAAPARDRIFARRTVGEEALLSSRDGLRWRVRSPLPSHFEWGGSQALLWTDGAPLLLSDSNKSADNEGCGNRLGAWRLEGDGTWVETLDRQPAVVTGAAADGATVLVAGRSWCAGEWAWVIGSRDGGRTWDPGLSSTGPPGSCRGGVAIAGDTAVVVDCADGDSLLWAELAAPDGAPAPAATTTTSVVPSAKQALECDFKGVGADSGPGNWEGDAGYASPREALQSAIREGFVIPQAGYRALARDDTAVLYGYEHKGKVKAAVRVGAVPGAEDGWVPERLIACRLAEYGPKADMGRGVWLWANRWDRTVQERVGPAHCDWQSARFLYWAPPGTPDTLRATSLYVRDPRDVFRDQWTVPYLRSTTLPSGARYTGYRRDGRALWLSADERAMYVKDGDRVERWPRIPTGTGCA